jgi:hypothetical protein
LGRDEKERVNNLEFCLEHNKKNAETSRHVGADVIMSEVDQDSEVIEGKNKRGKHPRKKERK